MLKMSVANYTTSVLEHTQILVGVKYSESVNVSSLEYVLSKLNCHKVVAIKDAGRTINVRFSTDTYMLNSRWGTFQAHRQAYGFVFIAGAANAMEAALIIDKFNKLRDEYGPDLCHSRCLIFGLDTAIRPSHSHNVFQFSSHHAWKSIDYDIKQFIISIFYELESKRLKLSLERGSKPSMMLAPFETAEEKMYEGDSKLIRKRFLGRHYKYLADINLLLGLLSESLLSYSTALDTLISTNDTVWVGCALEGYCVVSAIVLLSEMENDPLSQGSGNSKFALDPRNLSTKQGSTVSITDMKKLCIPSIKDLVDKYREAIINYSRHKSLAVIEMEACVKATKVFANAKKFLEASEFVQNAVYITLNVSDTERLKRYSVMADLYSNLNFNRKSFFYKRVAAMQCVAPQLKIPDWELCNELLMAAVSNLITAGQFPCDIEGHGWPSIIQRVWRELVFSLERVGDHVLANMYLLHMFLSMFPFMTEADEKETCSTLQNYTKISKGDAKLQRDDFPFDLKFYKLPVVKTVLPRIDLDGIRPIKSKMEQSPQSVFIYTPTQYQSKNNEQKKILFDWCVNTPCQFDIASYNPLLFSSVQISNFSLIFDAEGDIPDCPAISFSIPPQTTSKIQVIATPVSSGDVKIVGYAFQIFGVPAECYFKKSADMEMIEIQMHVIPELPLVKCSFQDENPAQFEKGVVVVHACHGEVTDLPYKLTNIGHSPVTNWTVTYRSKPWDDYIEPVFEEDFNGISLLPGETMTLPMKIKTKAIIEHQDNTIQSQPCTMCVKYAGEVNNGTWWRSIDVEMVFRLDMSVAVKKLLIKDGLVGHTTDNCTLIITLQNFFHTDAEVCFDSPDIGAVIQHSITIPQKSVAKLDVGVEKMKLLQKNGREGRIEDLLFTYIKEKLNLRWKITPDGTSQHSGTVVYACDLSLQNMSKMLDIPLTCSFAFDNKAIDDGSNCNVQTNEAHNVCFSFSNTGVFRQRFDAQLEVLQDQNNGYVERNLEETILLLGCAKSNLSIGPSDVSQFSCDMVILKEGIYTVRASYCVSLSDSKGSGVQIQCHSPSLLLNAQSYMPSLADSVADI